MDILYDYFLVPLMRNGWFNPVNSLVYGFGLIAGIWLVYALLQKVKVPVDRGLFLAVLPFIAFAGVTRALRDLVYFDASGTPGFLSSFAAYMQAMQASAYSYVLDATGIPALAYADAYIIAWFPTPGSYFITFALALASLAAGLIVRKLWKVECWKVMAALGTVFFLVNASLVPVKNVIPLLYIGAVALAWAGLFFALGTDIVISNMRRFNTKAAGAMKKFFTKMNSAILSAHMFDATATFFAISMFTTASGQGYTEQHFLSRGLMPFLGPGVMFLLKLAVVIPALWFIDRYMATEIARGKGKAGKKAGGKDKEKRTGMKGWWDRLGIGAVEENSMEMARFLKLAIFILGAAPATRNLVRLIAGV
jgi:uncharacterized membrane protein